MLIRRQDTRWDSKVLDYNHFPQELYKLGWQKEAHTHTQTKILTNFYRYVWPYLSLLSPPPPPPNKIQRR